ncbi:hypothetical protein CLV33_11431 [Jejuia pallidilutea]|uniref:Uncharacterized protein n=1 Tax=Jejuia pallidilutea TaxID=504487 RepID=A0A362WWV6_9FLAO|nr:hypothetical protein [Jejuia pallidilutea]PQV45264.1 hypothetical protein CLV33_11431 [Jejuia pallidilutea]
MKYLTPKIEALSKQLVQGKSLAKPNVSCGIFQDCNPLEDRSELYDKKQKLGN